MEHDYKKCPKYKKLECFDCSTCDAPDCANRKFPKHIPTPNIADKWELPYDNRITDFPRDPFVRLWEQLKYHSSNILSSPSTEPLDRYFYVQTT